MGRRKPTQISRTEEILSGIKKEARLKAELDRWLEANPGGDAMGLRIQIGAIRQHYLSLMTDEERSRIDQLEQVTASTTEKASAKQE